jgi:hypothetical protein
MKNDSLYNKLLLKPFLLLMVTSLLPLLAFLTESRSVILIILPFLNFAIFVQFLLLALFLFRVIKYFKYSKFETFEEAHQFFKDLKRVERAEKINRVIAIKNEMKLLKERKLERKKNKEIQAILSKKVKIAKLKKDLEERKKKVL